MVAAAGAWLAACGGDGSGAGAPVERASVPGDEAAVRAEIEAVTRRWEAALLAGTPDAAVAEVFTADAVRLPPGAPTVRGA